MARLATPGLIAAACFRAQGVRFALYALLFRCDLLLFGALLVGSPQRTLARAWQRRRLRVATPQMVGNARGKALPEL